MEQSKIDWFVTNNGNKLKQDKLNLVVEKMKTMGDDKFALLQSTAYYQVEK